MPAAEPTIVVCPPQLRGDALALVLGDVAPSLRGEIGAAVLHADPTDADRVGIALFIVIKQERICGAAWGQLQPGRTAVFWPPRFDPPQALNELREKLSNAVLAALDETGVTMTQVLLPSADAPDAAALPSLGFRFLAELEYLTWERKNLATDAPVSTELEFVPYDESQRQRMLDVIERTYVNTLDCADLGGERRMDDVLAGYRATGEFRPENWFFVRAKIAGENGDVGVLLLADHRASQHLELVYMGLAPEARGKNWGMQIVRHAQHVARRDNCDRIVLAVDAANYPAKSIYTAARFEIWDRRSVFLRFGGKSANST